MNPKIKKAIDDIEKTKAKIAELQAMLPGLEHKRVSLENDEIIKLVRSANISIAEFPGFIKSLDDEKAVMYNSAEPIIDATDEDSEA